MERESLLYKTRRKMQVIANSIIPNELMSKFYYRIVLKKSLNLSNPCSFNEKIQWLKLYYYPYNKLVVKCTDKYSVRNYIEEKGYGDHLVKLYGVWDNANDIDWDNLPKQFVLKCSHGCAYNIIVTNKDAVNRNIIIKRLNSWLKEDFGAFNVEIHYSRIKKRVITCEEYLGEALTDYKFFCFNGTPYCLYVSTDLVHDRQASIGFFYLDGSKMPMQRDDYKNIKEIKLPYFYDDMKSAASELCRDFPFVRVDFFVTNNNWYFAELTFTPGAGMMPFNPDYYDDLWGEKLDIDDLVNNRANIGR